MFRRLVFDDSAAVFTIVAFVTAASIYVTFAWRALRMNRAQLAHFENLPFETPTPPAAPARPLVGPPQRADERRPRNPNLSAP